MVRTVMMVTQVTLFRLNSLVADRATYSGLLIIVGANITMTIF